MASVFLSRRYFMWLPARRCEADMLFDYFLGALVTVVIMVYLVYALINPERF
jgi:K+-transporting ATPase KdpF subunit